MAAGQSRDQGERSEEVELGSHIQRFEELDTHNRRSGLDTHRIASSDRRSRRSCRLAPPMELLTSVVAEAEALPRALLLPPS